MPPIHTPATELGPSTESRIAHVRAARSRRNGGYRQASAGCARENLLRPHSSEGLPLGHRPQDRIVRLSSPHCGNPRSSAPVSDACTAVAQRTRALVGTVGAAVDGRCGVENTIVIDVDLTVPRPNRHSTHVLPRLKNVHSCRQPRHPDLRSEPCFLDGGIRVGGVALIGDCSDRSSRVARPFPAVPNAQGDRRAPGIDWAF